MDPRPAEPPPAACAACGAAFRCGAQAGDRDCWCAALPPLAPVAGRGCLCRECLQRELTAAARKA